MNPPSEPDFARELVAARSALDRGELAHAAQHLSVALFTAPERPEGPQLVDRLVAATPEPLALASLGQVAYTGTAALRACILARQGQPAQAVGLILQVVMLKPDGNFLDWAVGWLQKPSMTGSLDLAAINSFLGWVLQRYSGNVIADEDSRALLGRILAFLEAARPYLPADQMFLFGRVSLLRKINRLDDALAAAQELRRAFPGYFAATALGMVYQARGDMMRWYECYQEALQYDMQSIPLRLEMGDRFWEAGQLENAAFWYEDALRLDPGNAWASPSLLCLRFYQSGDQQWRERLEDLAIAQPGNARARSLVQGSTPFVGFLPEPGDLLVNFTRMLLENLRTDPNHPMARGMLRVSALEAPSARLALALALGKPPEITLEVEAVQSPDPRQPRVPVDYLLWKYRGTEPVAAVREPAGDVVTAVCTLAASNYHLLAWSDHGRRVAATLGPPRVADLLGVMVHPPAAPPDVPAWVWLMKVQLAAALVLAHIDEGWQGSLRKKVLFSLANGPMDWTVSAAVAALTALALENQEIETEVARLFRELMHALPQGGYVCHAYPLVCCYLHLPHITAEERAILRQWRAGLARG
jgi:tetratricopeptide (TPR) repeat protein